VLVSVHILHFLPVQKCQYQSTFLTFFHHRSVSIGSHPPIYIDTELSVSVHTPHFISLENCQYQSTYTTFYQHRCVSIGSRPPIYIDTELSMSVHNVHFLSTQKCQYRFTSPTVYRYRAFSVYTQPNTDMNLAAADQSPCSLLPQTWQQLYTFPTLTIHNWQHICSQQLPRSIKLMIQIKCSRKTEGQSK
jgi:hypothetical protein